MPISRRATVVRFSASNHFSPMNTGLNRAFFRETVQGRGVGEATINREPGGAGAYAHVVVGVYALSRGRGNIFSWNARSTIPAGFAKAVIEGIESVVNAGVLAGFELIDVHISVEDGSYHEEDSTSDAFREAAAEAVADALHQAQPLILEAYSSLSVIVPAKLATVVQTVIGSEARQAVQSETLLHAITASIATSEVNNVIRKVLVVTGGVGQISCAHGGFRSAREPLAGVHMSVGSD
jgi:elongation factor G